ncbi:MAG: TRAP transporter substrate-binding protein [Enterobacteriaceae bacterium]
MKKKLIIITAALGLSLLSSVSRAEKETVLKIAHFLPSGSAAQQKVLQPWCDALRQAANNMVKCQFYPAMQLGGTPSQLVDQVRNGIADIVWTAPSYSAGRFPIIETLELPFIIPDSRRGSRASWLFYQQYAQDEFKQYKVLAVYNDGGLAVHTAKKSLTRADDWQGLKLRSSNRLIAKTLASLGSSAVAMPPGQITEAMAKGVIDGAMGTWEVVLPTKLDEVSRFHAVPPEGQPYPGSTVLVVLMNKRKFDSLPDVVKNAIDQSSGLPLVEAFGKVWDQEGEVARQKVIAVGNQITTFSAEEYQKMRELARPVEEEWIATMKQKGMDGRVMLDTVRQWASEQP